MRGRLLRLLFATVVGLGLAEAGVRVLYGDLPSVAAIEAAGFELVTHEARGPCPAPAYLRQKESRDRVVGEGPVLELWALGDSMTWGVGVEAEQTWPWKLAGQMAEGRQVRLSNLGMPGAGICDLGVALDRALREGSPDQLVVGLYADDLEHLGRLAVRGEPVAFPSQARPAALVPVVSGSYLANLVWFGAVGRSGSAPRVADADSQVVFTDTIRMIDRRVADAGGDTLFVLVPPLGLSGCTPSDDEEDACGRLSADLAVMRERLSELQVEVLDLSSIWDDGDIAPIDQEADWELAIHPGPEGHSRLAEAIAQAL